MDNQNTEEHSVVIEPSLSERKDDAGVVSPSDERITHKVKESIFWHKFLKILTIKIIALTILILFLLYFGVAFAQAPIHELIDQVTKPKPITQSSKVLPTDIQEAIQDQAQQQINQQRATALVATNTSGGSSQGQNSNVSTVNPLTTLSFQTVQQQSFISNIVYPFQLLATTNPVDKAKVRLNHIDGEIQQIQSVLQSNTSDATVNQAVDIIQHIGQETGQIVVDKNVQTDREVLTHQIEQYTRLQLILQKIEDTLPIDAYLRVDGAREKYLVRGAQQAINTAPNLDVINAIGIAETRKIVGNDFAELKAIETLTDISNGLKSKTQQKLARVQKQLALQFEKRMLTLSADVRNTKLQNYIVLSYGNPLNQVQAFDQMQHFLTDREMILSVGALKQIALKKLENRILEIKTLATRDQFIALNFHTPQSMEVLTQVQLDASSLASTGEKKQITNVETASRAKIAQTLDTTKNLNTFFAPEVTETTNLLDTVVAGNLATVLENSSQVTPEVKTDMQTIQQKILENFVSGVTQNSFVTTPSIAYNPVSENADVRLLLPEPQTIPLLEEIRSELPDTQKSVIDTAQKAENNILVDSLLTKVNDPQVFQEDKQIIDATPGVKQALQANASQTFFDNLDKKEQIIVAQAKQEDQQLYETIQQINQTIFTANGTTTEEKQLPQAIQTEIDTLKKTLADNEIPKLDIPTDVTLPTVAVLPTNVQDALITAAKNKINSESQQNATDITTEAKDLGVSVPSILPDSPLYPLIALTRDVTLLIQPDPITKAEELIKQDNEKTIEAAELITNNGSTTSTYTAVKMLESVSSDFDQLQQHADLITNLKQTEPQRVDAVATEIIDNGVVRQTVLSQIEQEVHGETYIAVEKLRQDILQDGIDTILHVADNNVEKLTGKLENAVTNEIGSTNTAVVEDIRTVDVLNEVARKQPETSQEILQKSETSIAQKLESTLDSLSAKEAAQEMLSYANNFSGNPARQFEAEDIVKNDFTKPADILLVQELKDRTAQNLEERISEIPNANAQAEFTNIVIGNEPQDLKIITEIQDRVSPPQNAGVVEKLPIVEKVQEIQASIQQNIIETYKNNPEGLKKADFFDNPTLTKTPDIVDVQVAQDVNTALSQARDTSKEVVQVAQTEESKIITTFVDNISSPAFMANASVSTEDTVSPTQGTNVSANAQISTTQASAETPTTSTLTALAAQTLGSVPDALQILLDLKNKVPTINQTQINTVIDSQVALIERIIATETNPVAIETYVAQIQNNPEVAQVVAQIGGQELQQTIATALETAKEQTIANETQLQTTVNSVQQEVFSAPISSPSTIQQSLPQPIQQEIQQIKQEVPSQQVPSVNVATEASISTAITVQPTDTTPIATPAPLPPVVLAPVVPAPTSQPSSPQPAAIAPAPQAQSAPEQPAAPVAPGL